MKTTLAVTPVTAAIEAARKAINIHAEGQSRIAALQVELENAVEIESAGAVEALEVGNQIPEGGRAANIGAQIRILERACTTTVVRARQAICSIYTAAAEQELAFAEEKRRQRAQIREKNRKPLAELSLNEGVAFTEFILDCQPQGIWEGVFTGAEPDFNTCGPGDVICRGGGINPQPWFIRSSRRLDAEIKAHEARATELAQRQIDPGGDLAVVLETVIGEVTPSQAAMATEAA